MESGRGSAVGNDGLKHRALAELARFVLDLDGKLTSRSDDDCLRALGRVSAVSVATVLEDLVKDGEEEGGSLAGSGLGATHHVPPGHNDRDGVLLHGRGLQVAGLLDIILEEVAEAGALERGDRLGNVLAGDFHLR